MPPCDRLAAQPARSPGGAAVGVALTTRCAKEERAHWIDSTRERKPVAVAGAEVWAADGCWTIGS